MARLARIVAPGLPHHITQRGNRRQKTFFRDDDYQQYLNLMREWCERHSVEIWAYCLMPNHVHLVAVPETEDGLAKAIGEAHRRYTRYVNFRKGWTGYLWQGRFASFPMDETYLLAATKYIEMNPVRASMVDRSDEYQWSSARAHLQGNDDRLVKVRPLLEMVDNWTRFLSVEPNEEEMAALRLHARTGRALGADGFIRKLEIRLNRLFRRQKPGPKKNN